MANDIFPGAQLIQGRGWGYPMGSPRPAPPAAKAFSVIHITAGTGTAQAEANWRLTSPETKNSATFFVNRDGSAVQCLGDPLHMDPWTNGVINRPDLTNPRIAQVVRDGVNANERSLVTIENCGLEPGSPITSAQIMTAGRILAYYHTRLGIPVNRETVIGHYQIDSVNRPNCPSTNKNVINAMIAAAGGTTGDSEVNVTTKIYPWPRTWYTKGGALVGYKLSDEPNVTAVFTAGSPAPSSAAVSIDPLPADWGWPAGPYQLVSAGPLKGCLVANSQITLGPEPIALAEPPTTADCAAQIDEATKALQDQLALEKAATAEAEQRVSSLQQLIGEHNAVEEKMKAVS